MRNKRRKASTATNLRARSFWTSPKRSIRFAIPHAVLHLLEELTENARYHHHALRRRRRSPGKILATGTDHQKTPSSAGRPGRMVHEMEDRREPRDKHRDSADKATPRARGTTLHFWQKNPVENRGKVPRSDAGQATDVGCAPEVQSTEGQRRVHDDVSSHNRRSVLSVENKARLFLIIVRPTMTYCSPVWGYAAATRVGRLQVVQNKILRMAVDAPW